MGQKPPIAPKAPGNANEARQRGRWDAGLRAFRQAATALGAPPVAREDEGLGAALAAAAEQIELEAGMERAGITGDYAARMRYARRHLPRNQVAGAIRQLKDQKAAALAQLARRTAQRLKGRLAAIRAVRRLPRSPRPG